MGGLFKPKPDDFARAVLKECRAAGLEGDYDAEKFEIRFSGGAVLWLGNVFTQYCQSRSHRAAVLAQIVGMISQASQELPGWEEARERLLPRPVHRLSLEESRWRGTLMPHQLLVPRLAITVVLDFPDRIMHLGANALEKWDKQLSDCLGPARDNLWRISNEPFQRLAPGLWAAPWKDNYTAARIVLESLLLKLEIQGDPVVWAPDRDTLWVTGSENPEGLKKIFATLEKQPGRNYPVCLAPLRLAGERWEEFAPPGVERFLTAVDYAEQGQALNRWHEETGEDVYVANCGTIKDKASQQIAFTWTGWHNDIESLLPRVDRVFLGDAQQTILHDLTWDEVVERYGAKMQPTDLWPPRWRVGAWR